MVASEHESSKQSESERMARPSQTKTEPAQPWTLKEADAALHSSAEPGSESIFYEENDAHTDISNTGTYSGSPFQQDIELEAGAIIGGNYRIQRLIGKGGMGQVYLADHIPLAKKCALKVMPSNQVTQKAWKRFQTEAKAISKLEHTNLVRVTDLGIHDNALPYFAMEYVDGQTLAQLLSKRGRLDQETILDAFVQICDGIECAHKQGIVHRDLKPANIMLVEDGINPSHFRVKILDFGLAKLSQREAADLNLTGTGEIFGSPLYMSPEQCAGQSTDMRSDIYSLGCTIFECMTGRPPFTGEMAIPIMNRKIFEEAPTLSSACDGQPFPAELEFVIAKMLKRNAQERYQNIADLKVDLKLAMSGQPPVSFQPMSDRQLNSTPEPPKKLSEQKDKARVKSFALLSMSIGMMSALLAVSVASGLLLRKPYPRKHIELSAPQYLEPGPPRYTLHPVSSDIPDYVGAEGWLDSIRSCTDEMYNSSGNFPGDPVWHQLTPERKKELEEIIGNAESHLLALGSRAIPACTKDLYPQTLSSVVSGRALISNGAAAVDPLIALLVHQPSSAPTVERILVRLGPSVGEKLCKLATSTKDLQKKRLVASTLAELVNWDHPSDVATYGEQQPVMSGNQRNSLLKLLKNETDDELKQDLIDALACFKSPAADEVAILSPILKNDPSLQVQQAAARTLGSMLSGASQSSASEIIGVLCEALSSANQSEQIKIACLEALARAKVPFEASSLSTLRAAAQDHSVDVKEKALQVLAAQDAFNGIPPVPISSEQFP